MKCLSQITEATRPSYSSHDASTVVIHCACLELCSCLSFLSTSLSHLSLVWTEPDSLMADANTNQRDWLEGLSPAALGVFDNRSLRFIEGAALVAGGDQDAVLPEEQVEVTNVKLLGSYNWTGQASPAILIPGAMLPPYPLANKL
jgi:hypothetical protein